MKITQIRKGINQAVIQASNAKDLVVQESLSGRLYVGGSLLGPVAVTDLMDILQEFVETGRFGKRSVP